MIGAVRLQPEVVLPTTSIVMENVVPAEAGDGDVAEVVVAHPGTRLQRGEVVPVDVGDDAAIPAGQIGLQRARHADGVQTLPAVFSCGEALVHVDVLVAEVQPQSGEFEVGRLRRVPAVRGESGSGQEAIAFVAFSQSLVEEPRRKPVLRVDGELPQHGLIEEEAAVFPVALEEGWVDALDADPFQDLEADNAVGSAHAEIGHRFGKPEILDALSNCVQAHGRTPNGAEERNSSSAPTWRLRCSSRWKLKSCSDTWTYAAGCCRRPDRLRMLALRHCRCRRGSRSHLV